MRDKPWRLTGPDGRSYDFDSLDELKQAVEHDEHDDKTVEVEAADIEAINTPQLGPQPLPAEARRDESDTPFEEVSMRDVTLEDATPLVPPVAMESAPISSEEVHSSDFLDETTLGGSDERAPISLTSDALIELPAASRHAPTLPPALRRPPPPSSLAPPEIPRNPLPSISAPPQPTSQARWLAVGTLLVVIAGGAAYAMMRAQPRTTAAATDSPRAQAIEDAERALDLADLDRAERVLGATEGEAADATRARIAAIRADYVWLTLKLSPADPTPLEKSLRDLMTEARAVVEKAQRSGGTAVSRSSIDLMRMRGEFEAAKALVRSVEDAPIRERETDYVLGAWELAQPVANLQKAIARLEIAARGESAIARARAALVVAHLLAGDRGGAIAWLDALKDLPPSHPLRALGFFELARTRATTTPLATAASQAPTVPSAGPSTVSVAPTARDARNAAPSDEGRGSTEAKGTQDLSGLHKAAAAARRAGDVARAKQLYERALDINPSDSEAFSGLGDTARSSGDSTGAVNYYRSALKLNPKYLPANIGLADALWDSGQRAEAQQKYAEIAASYPEDLVPDRARQRANSQ